MDRIPMRWPAEWTEPSRLELLEGTPINCLVGESPPPFPLSDGLEFISLKSGSPPEGVSLQDGAWPGVKGGEQNDSTESGPTGAPWVDSNAGIIRLTQALEPDSKVWLTYLPPGKSEVVPFSDFVRPVAEAEAYGAHWVITLHESLRKGIESDNPEALASWKQMADVLQFSSKHQEWEDWKPAAALAVISDFEGDNEFLANEFLNLAPRRNLAYRIIRKDEAAEASLDGQKGVVFIDVEPPEGALREKLLAFAEAGGLVVLPRAIDGLTSPVEQRRGYELFSHGQGRIAVPIEDWYDPYVLAAELHLLLSHRTDVVRIWNGGMMNAHYVESGDGKRGVVHIVEYARRRNRNDDITLGFSRPYVTAKVFTLDGVSSVKPTRTRLGIEVPLPPFSVYVAVEMGV